MQLKEVKFLLIRNIMDANPDSHKQTRAKEIQKIALRLSFSVSLRGEAVV